MMKHALYTVSEVSLCVMSRLYLILGRACLPVWLMVGSALGWMIDRDVMLHTCGTGCITHQHVSRKLSRLGHGLVNLLGAIKQHSSALPLAPTCVMTFVDL